MTWTWEQAIKEGRAARQRRDGAQWALGDLACKVEGHVEDGRLAYGEQILQRYAEEIEVEYHTLRDYRFVASAFASAERSANLSWSVHQIVASRPDRAEWLQRAEQHGWSARRLREELRTARHVERTVATLPPVRRAVVERVYEAQRDGAPITRGDFTGGEHRRVSELVREGVLQEVGKSVSAETGRTGRALQIRDARDWDVTGEAEMYPDGEPPGTEDDEGWAVIYVIERITRFVKDASSLACVIHPNQAYRLDRDLPLAVRFINEFSAAWEQHHGTTDGTNRSD